MLVGATGYARRKGLEQCDSMTAYTNWDIISAVGVNIISSKSTAVLVATSRCVQIHAVGSILIQ